MLDCAGQSFLYTTAAGGVAVDLPTNGYAADFSLDGNVFVGSVAGQALRKVGTVSSLFGPLTAGNPAGFTATSNVLSAIGTSDLTGWRVASVTAISDDGKFLVGSGQNPANASYAWIAHLP